MSDERLEIDQATPNQINRKVIHPRTVLVSARYRSFDLQTHPEHPKDIQLPVSDHQHRYTAVQRWIANLAISYGSMGTDRTGLT